MARQASKSQCTIFANALNETRVIVNGILKRFGEVFFGGYVACGRDGVVESMMRTLVVVAVAKRIKEPLLRLVRMGPLTLLIEGAVDAFMATVLCGASRVDALGSNL